MDTPTRTDRIESCYRQAEEVEDLHIARRVEDLLRHAENSTGSYADSLVYQAECLLSDE